MTTKALKAIGIGVLSGAAIFFLPFPFRSFFVFFFFFLVFRFFWWGGWRYRRYDEFGYGIWNNPSYARRWYSMNDDERKTFMQKVEKELFAGTGPSSENK